MPEQFSNLAQTALSGPAAPSDTTITVLSVGAFPSASQYRVRVDNEIMIVTGGAGSLSWTVTRGAEGSPVAAHATGASVTHVLTAGALGGTSDPAAGTPGLRTLGAGSQQAMPGNQTLDQIARPVANVDMGSERIVNLLDPAAAQDAATKHYVDNASGSSAPTGPAGGALAGTYPDPSLAPSSVSSANIVDGTIVDGDVSGTAAIAATKVSGTAVTLADSGTVTNSMLAGSIAPSKVTGTAITAADTGTVTNGMLAGSIAPSKVTGTAITAADTGTVTSAMILDGTLVNGDINSAASITPGKISGTAVTQSDVGTVTNTMLAGSVSPSKITAGANTQILTTTAGVAGWAAGSAASSAAGLRWYDTKDYGAKSDLTKATLATVTGGNATFTGTTYSGTSTDAGKLIRIQAAGAQLFNGTDGAMTFGTATTNNRFTSASSSFDQTCVGRWIIISGQFTARVIGVESATQLRLATPASGSFSAATWTINEDHYTTIASSVASTSVTVSVAPLQSVTNAIIWYGTDDAAAIQAAVTAAESATVFGGNGNQVYHYGASAIGSPIYLQKPTQFLGAGSRGYGSVLGLGATRLMLLKPHIQGIVGAPTTFDMGYNGAMTSGSGVLIDPEANFPSGIVGYQIIVYKAGTQTGSTDGIFVNTTVASRQSATQITLTANAGTTISGGLIYSYGPGSGYAGGLTGPSVKNVHIVGGPGQKSGLHLVNCSEDLIESVVCSDFGSGVGHFIEGGPSAGFSNQVEWRSNYAVDCRIGLKHDRGAIMLTGMCFIDGNSNRVDCQMIEDMTIGIDCQWLVLGGQCTIQAVGTAVKSDGRGGGSGVHGTAWSFENIAVMFSMASDGSTGGHHNYIGFHSAGNSNAGGAHGLRLKAGSRTRFIRGYSLDSDIDMYGLVDSAAFLSVIGEQVVKSGSVGDSDFTNQPWNAWGFDSSTGDVYVRIPTTGTWRKFTSTGTISRVKLHDSKANTTSSATRTLAITSTVPVGHFIVVPFVHGLTTQTMTVTDTQSNTYTTDVVADMATSNTPHAGLAIARVTTQLTSADTITVTAAAAVNVLTAEAYEYVGLATSSWVDGTPSGAIGTGTAVDSGATTTDVTNTLLLGVACIGSGGAVPPQTPTGGWTTVSDFTINSSTKRYAFFEKSAPTTAAYDLTTTLSGSADWAACIAAVKPA